MPRTRMDEHGRLVEIPPTVLDCGHPFAGNVTIGYQPGPGGDRRRSYWCKTCRTITWD